MQTGDDAARRAKRDGRDIRLVRLLGEMLHGNIDRRSFLRR
jgi:hypothetical protein